IRPVTEAECVATSVTSLQMKQRGRKKKDLFFCTQQGVIELADLFHPALPSPVIGQPEFHHLPLLRPDAELPVTANYRRWKRGMEEICELNHALLRAEE